MIQVSHATITINNGEYNTRTSLDRVFCLLAHKTFFHSVGGTKWHIKHIDHGGTFYGNI